MGSIIATTCSSDSGTFIFGGFAIVVILAIGVWAIHIIGKM